jgi:D-hexose-6-phosphate mutarotase
LKISFRFFNNEIDNYFYGNGRCQMTLNDLNEKYGIADKIVFEKGTGGLSFAVIKNDLASASICLLGAHVTSFQPVDDEPVLWLSEKSFYEEGKAIRGGIPICWPWFGMHPDNATLPAHGFVRTRLWEVQETAVLDDGSCRVVMGLGHDSETLKLWPCYFELKLVVTVGRKLEVELQTTNQGCENFTFSNALHTYFNVSDIRNVTVFGLKDTEYIDTVNGVRERKTQAGEISFTGETDRVYLDTTAACRIKDSGLKRDLLVEKNGSRTTVVWNPWIDKSKRMPDFGDDEFNGMLCVETVNSENDSITLEPGQEHKIKAIISVDNL